MAPAPRDPREVVRAAAGAILAEPGLAPSRLAKLVHIPRRRLAAVVGPEIMALVGSDAAATVSRGAARSKAWRDDEILEHLRGASRWLPEGPVTVEAYGTYAASAGFGGPHAQTVIRRFGSWSQALDAAGVDGNAALREYDREWTEELVVEALADFVLEHGHLERQRYRDTTARSPVRPSAAQVEKLMSWPEARVRALRLAGQGHRREEFEAMVAACAQRRCEELER